MKSIAKFLAIGVLTASTTLAAHATPINGSISGNDDLAVFNNANATFGGLGTINFGASGSVSSVPVGLGGFFTNGQPMTFYQNPQAPAMGTGDFFYSPTAGGTLTLAGSTPTSGGVEVFSVTEAGETLAFYVTSDTTMAVFGNSTNLPEGVLLTGTGYFIETGAVNYDTTPASFTLNGSNSTSVFSFGGTATANPPGVPEPSSLMLLGTGLVSAAGMAFRRRRAIG
jgi:PEP-CTERM motif